MRKTAASRSFDRDGGGDRRVVRFVSPRGPPNAAALAHRDGDLDAVAVFGSRMGPFDFEALVAPRQDDSLLPDDGRPPLLPARLWR